MIAENKLRNSGGVVNAAISNMNAAGCVRVSVRE